MFLFFAGFVYKIKVSSFNCFNVIDEYADSELRSIDKRITGVLNAKKYSYIKLVGKKIVPGTIIVAQIQVEPDFGEVLDIFSAKNEVYIYLKMLEITQFDEHYHAWKVQVPAVQFAKKRLINIKNLPEVDPCIFHVNSQGSFVATRYKL